MNVLEYLEQSNKLDDSYFIRNFNMSYSYFFENNILLNEDEFYTKIEGFLKTNSTFEEMEREIENFLSTLSLGLEGTIDNDKINLKKKIVLYHDFDYTFRMINEFQFIKRSKNYIITFPISSVCLYSITQEQTLKETYPNDYEQKRNPFICQNYIFSSSKKYFLSTVYLGKTAPFTFSYETMLFDNSEDADNDILLQERFTNKEDAIQFHTKKLRELLEKNSSEIDIN